MSNLERYLTIRILYPKPEHLDDVLSAVKRISEKARQFDGLIEIGAWLDKDRERVVNVTLWETKERAAKATKEMHPLFADIPWEAWERAPVENYLTLQRVV